MTLYIDTNDFRKMRFALLSGKKIAKEKKYSLDPFKSAPALEKLEEFLEVSKVGLQGIGIKKIQVKTGNKSFSGVRWAATISQALAMAWGVKVEYKK